MHICFLITGSGGAFYCENCSRDSWYVKAMKEAGIQISILPMYLPVTDEGSKGGNMVPVFYGAVSLYLKHLFPFLRLLPARLTSFLDAPGLLHWVAGKAGSTRAKSLASLTLSMLKGEDGGQCADLAKMTSWLKKNMKPDLIYLSNCLLIGLAGTLKKELNLPIICALQDEDTWIDELPREYQDLCWSEIKSRIQDVDLFFPPSRYFAERMQKLLEIPATKIEILPSGIDYGSYKDIEPAFDSPAIGFLSRLSPLNGLELLIEAFIKIKASEGLKKTKLLLAGGYTKDDLPFLKKMKKNLLQAGLLDSVSFREGFSPKERYDFFKQLTVFTVPAPAGNAFGIFQLEASLAQVPVVLPDTGAFPEVLALTQGGSTFQSGNVDSLVTALTAFLTNPVVAGIVGRRGRQGVKKFFETRTITARMIKVMEDLIVENGRKNQTYVRMSEPK